MKKNIAINLRGRLFNIDEDAYQLLKHYIDTLRRYYSKTEGDSEIADDIESRVAELFEDLKAGGVEAINIEHVQDIISRIGELEDLAPEDASANTAGSSATDGEGAANASFGQQIKDGVGYGAKSAWDTFRSGKRFYRDIENKMFAGVLAGCARFFGGSPLAWRIGFILSFLVLRAFTKMFHLDTSGIAMFFFFGYMAFAILAPKAENPEDVLQMKGEDVTPQNIGEEVKKQASQQGSALGSFLGFLFKMLLVFVAFVLGITAFSVLCFGAVLLVDPVNWFGQIFDFNISSQLLEAIRIPLYCGFGAVALIAVTLLYCVCHAVASTFGSTPPMSFGQRITGFVIILVGCVAFVASIAKGIAVAEPFKDQIRQELIEHDRGSHVHYGYNLSDDDISLPRFTFNG